MTEDIFLNRRAALARLALFGAVALPVIAGVAPAFADDDGGSGGDDHGSDDGDHEGHDDNGNDDAGDDNGNDSSANSGDDKPKNLLDMLRGKNRRRKHG